MKRYIIYIISIITISACTEEVLIEPGSGYDDWSEETHSNNSTPNYNQVFQTDEVQRLDIVFEPEYWEAMQANLDIITGTSTNTQTMQPPSRGQMPGQNQGQTPGQMPTSTDEENPIYVPCQVFYNDMQWYDVGIRYKGNSSLKLASRDGAKKFPFRLEFNHFEDENPYIWEQNFYGFQQLSFSSGYHDMSLMREMITPGLFRDFGVPAAKTAFYRIYVDHGEGPEYFGLYTMVEIIFDTMIKEQFEGENGNCYKPDAAGAYLTDANVLDETTMPNKTNEGDYSDVINLINALNSSQRISNAEQWRQELEKAIDMEQYLKYLAANTTIANWDTYGLMSHNYYLYTNPGDGRINWIPWDHNESLTMTGSREALEFDFNNMENPDSWPLINFIYNDEVYHAKYIQYINEFVQTVFTPENVQGIINDYASMIEEYTIGQNGESGDYTFLVSDSDWTEAVAELNDYITERHDAANEFVEQNK